MTKLLLILILALSACTTVPYTPTPEPSASPSPIATASPVPPITGDFVTLGEGSGAIDKEFALKAIALMNKALASGCLKSKVMTHKGFTSFNTVFEESPKTATEAYAAYVAGAPYALDLRWYSKRFTSVIGYTYNFKDDDWNAGSETRIWTNTRKMGDEKAYASHLAHELSHQARGGGFTHYTVFDGSFPYEIGRIMAECVETL